MLFLTIFIIFIISMGLSLWSLKGELRKHEEVEKVERELSKGKVIFQASSSASSEDV